MCWGLNVADPSNREGGLGDAEIERLADELDATPDQIREATGPAPRCAVGTAPPEPTPGLVH